MKNFRFYITIIIAYSCCTLTSPTHSMDTIIHTIDDIMHENLHTLHQELETLAETLTPKLVKHISNHEESTITNNPHRLKETNILHSTSISHEEQQYLKERLPIVKAALEKMLQRPLKNEHVPKIAFITSGGGYRAMLCTTGSLCAAQELGLLDAITYITALSGSTWAVAPWISTKKPILEFKDYLQKCAAKSFFDLTKEEKLLIAHIIAVKKIYEQPRTLVDPYGDLLANRLLEALGDLRQNTYLSDQATIIENGSYPYPIYTVTDGREHQTDPTWYEFTPHTVRNFTHNIHIPTWAFGRTFKKGQSTNDAPEKPLGYILGTCGSAFAANIETIVKSVIKNKPLQEDIKTITHPIATHRPLHFCAKVSNYMYKMENLDNTGLSKKKHLKLVDAGLTCNLPYLPVSGICKERAPEILFFLDASAGHIGGELHKVAMDAKKHNLHFPEIDLTDIDKKTISIFKDEKNTNAPVVIYMPRISDKELWEKNKTNSEFKNYQLSGFDLNHETDHGFCATKHFHYTPEHSSQVMDQTMFNMITSKQAIIDTLNWVIDRK
ncbi:MAG TPA: hypothetical protein VLB80_01255 [Candidatus Babeliales bacterium]|nr:hypothetical protein [Candidatus Babeliales bacterium]